MLNENNIPTIRLIRAALELVDEAASDHAIALCTDPESVGSRRWPIAEPVYGVEDLPYVSTIGEETP